MKSKHRMKLLFLHGFLLLVTGCLGACAWRPLPSDAEMIRFFHQNKPALERIVQLDQEDQHKMGAFFNQRNMYPLTSWPALPLPDLPPARIAEYNKDLASIGMRGYVSSPMDVRFSMFESHFIFDWKYKGLVFTRHTPTTLRDTLDKNLPEEDLNLPDPSIYRHLEGDWYLYYVQFTIGM